MVHLVTLDACPPEHIELLNDPKTGLRGAIVIHSTALGPAAGGCRFWRYSGQNALVVDAIRLAKATSYQNAIAGLPLGGGKAVLQVPDRSYSRTELFKAFGRAVAQLDGQYITADDVGTTAEDMAAVWAARGHLLGASAGTDGAGDPSAWTARGVMIAMEVAAKRRLGRPLSDLRVAVQGLGSVGSQLCRLLYQRGAQLIVNDPREGVADRIARRYGAIVLEKTAIVEANADILAPCAFGGVLNEVTIPRIKAKIVCGSANNQLATGFDGERLGRAGILYAPDYVVNAGGVIQVAAQHLGWAEREAASRVDQIGAKLGEVLNLADAKRLSSNRAADFLAREAMTAVIRATPLEVAAE